MMHAMPPIGPISLAAAFVAGIAGSVHCLAMCGGISGALGMHARRQGLAPRRAIAHALCQQFGRVASYTAVGALCGAFAGALAPLLGLNRLALAARALTGLFLVALATRVLFEWRGFGGVERLGARVWRSLAPLARKAPTRGFVGSLALGIIWGWMPCGLVYFMLMFAALAGNALQGAATMLLFGLGTWPAVLGGSMIGAHGWRVGAARGVNTAAGALLFVFGLLTLLAPLLQMRH